RKRKRDWLSLAGTVWSALLAVPDLNFFCPSLETLRSIRIRSRKTPFSTSHQCLTYSTSVMEAEEMQKHLGFMRQALEMVFFLVSFSPPTLLTCVFFQAERALAIDEVPVGCVFVKDGQVIGRGMNDTNRSLCVRL